MPRNHDETVPTNEKFDFKGNLAFVSEAAGGIAGATALAFARDGVGLVLADIDEQVIRSRIADPPPRQLEPNPSILPSISRRHHQ